MRNYINDLVILDGKELESLLSDELHKLLDDS